MFRAHRVLALLFLIYVFPSLASAQAEHIVGDHSGWSVSGDIARNDYMTAAEVRLGRVESGAIDVGLSIGEGTGVGPGYFSLGTFLDFYPIKQSARFPVTFGAGAAFQYQFIGGSYRYDSKSDAAGALQAQLCRRFGISSKCSIQPSLGVHYVFRADNDDVASARFFGLSLIIAPSSSIVALTPRISYSDQVTTYGFAVTWVGFDRTRQYEKDEW